MNNERDKLTLFPIKNQYCAFLSFPYPTTKKKKNLMNNSWLNSYEKLTW